MRVKVRLSLRQVACVSMLGLYNNLIFDIIVYQLSVEVCRDDTIVSCFCFLFFTKFYCKMNHSKQARN